MSLGGWLEQLSARRVELWFEGQQLRFRAPKGALTTDDRILLRERRSEILDYLRQTAAASQRVFPLSYSQQSLWFLHQQAPSSTAYNIALSARILEPVDTRALGHAVQALSDVHAVLRTTYRFAGSAPMQHVAGEAKVPLEQHAVPGVDEQGLRALVDADFHRPFDLEHGPVLRVSLYTRRPAEHVLLLAVHHIAADGWSLMVLFDDLVRLYREGVGGPPAAIVRSGYEYSDYAAHEMRRLEGPNGERLWRYWESKLAPPRARLTLPIDRPHPVVRSFLGASVSITLDAEQTRRLKELARAQSATMFVVLLAAFQAFLSRISGAEDVIVGTPVFSRDKAELMRVVGDFVNTVPLRGRVTPLTTFRGFIAQLRSTVHEALDAADLPLSLMIRRLAPERDAGRTPLFDTFFLLQRFDAFRELDALLAGDVSSEPVAFNGLRLAPFPLGQQEGQFDLALSMIERGDIVVGAFKYATDVFDAATIRQLATNFVSFVGSVAADPDIPFADSSPMTADRSASTRASELLARLRALDIQPFLDGDKLRVNAPKGAVTEELRAAITENRDGLIAALRDGDGRTSQVIPPVSRSGRLLLSSAQQRLWFLDQMEPGRSHYNVTVAIRIIGPLQPSLFEAAVNVLVQRHEPLRTRIGERDGLPAVDIAESIAAPVELLDVSAMPPDEADAAAREASLAFIRRPFSLARGPLFGCLLITLAPEKHELTLSLHHIIADGWSTNIFIRELWLVYDALVAGRQPALPALTVQAVDYAAWEREQLQSGRIAGHLAYWKRELAGAPAVLELPLDRPRPPASSLRGQRLRCFGEMPVLEELKALSARNGATLYMTLLAAWMVLMHRYSGQDDIVVGSPIANRDQLELEGLIGCFVNNVVLRGNLADNPRFSDFLAKVRVTTLGAFDHRELPFDVLVDALRPERTTSHAPIVQVLFTLHTFPAQFNPPEGTSVELVERELGASRFDLTLEVIEFQGQFHLTYEFATDLFDAATIARLHEHYLSLLRTIVRDADMRVRDLPLLTSVDLAQLNTWNQTERTLEGPGCVHQLFEVRAAAAPERVAVVAEDTALTYQECEQRANRLAHLLIARGVQPGSLVAVCVDRTADMPVVLAAVLKTGAAYVPLDPTHPADRLRYTLSDAGVACAVTLTDFAPLLADAQAPLVLLDQISDELAASPASAPDVTVKPEDRAYVIYTSGSTGRPKGVEVEHRNVVAFLAAMATEPGFRDDDVLLAVTTLSFDIAGLEMWLPLTRGGKVVIAGRADVLDGRRLIAMLIEHRVTVMQATPATWRLMLDAGWSGKADLRVLCGGEALPKDLAHALADRVGELWNMYGPTETTIWSTVSLVPRNVETITVGRPIANTTIYVLDPSGQPAPIGVAGELCIGGAGVARGYHERPDLTAEKFVTLTLPTGLARVYRTGDVARLLADGCIDFLGRRDHQVKVRGYRIELGEIEHVLAAQPGVKECVVAVREDRPGDQQMVGYVVEQSTGGFSADDARAALRGKLPEYMVPNRFMLLAALPLTPNGKIDRKALPAPTAAEEREASGNEAAAADALMTPPQRRVAATWREVLQVTHVGLHDNFFDVGGHSMLLVRLHAALEREFSAQIPLVELFRYTTIAGQADRLSSASQGDDGALLRARARAGRLIHG
ncbi:MAG: amino acid adenylation domain-containing protein [Vicinamibacterales bacterium]